MQEVNYSKDYEPMPLAGFIFLFGEWRQIHYIRGTEVKPGHPFAMGSNHFKASSIVGILLVAILIIVSVFVGGN